jgi:HEAT repeat protein
MQSVEDRFGKVDAGNLSTRAQLGCKCWGMKIHRLLQIALLAFTCESCVGPLLPAPEPTYHGKKLSKWLQDLGYDTDVITKQDKRRNQQAEDAIRAMGTNTFPMLLQDIGSENQTSRYEAMWAFHALGPIAEPLVPQLSLMLDTTKDEAKAKMVAIALNGIGSSAIPSLIMAFTNTNHFYVVHLVAVSALAGYGAKARVAIPALIAARNDPDIGLRKRAIWALGEIGGEASLVVPALISSLQDDDYRCRTDAAEALKKYGKEAKAAVAALLKALNDEHPWVRDEATEALKVIAPEAMPHPTGTQ